MTLYRRVFMVIALLIGGMYVAIAPQCAWACSCLPAGSPEEELENATAVFAGQVQGFNENGGNTDAGTTIEVVFNTSQVWKGDVSSEVIVTTSDSSASCGFNFELGQEYLVYAHTNDDGTLNVTLCSRTQTLADADEDLATLGEGQATPGETGSPEATPEASPSPEASPAASPEATPAVLPETSSPSRLTSWIAIGGLGVLMVVIAGYILASDQCKIQE